MMRFTRSLPFAAALLASTLSGADAETYRVDPARTEIAFEIGAKGYPVTHGVFRRFSSSLSIDLDRPARSSVTFKVSAASLDTRSPALDAYVRGPVFLNADRFPEISFVSTSVQKLDDHTVRVTGNLTLLGVTRPQSFIVQVERGQGRAFAFQAEGSIRRSQFGMTGAAPLVSDDVRIIVATRADTP